MITLSQMLLLAGAVLLVVVGFLYVGERVQAWQARFDELDPPPVDKSHGTGDWDWPKE